ncbi:MULTISPECIES: thioredoxin family protein [Methanocorpusculum]|jgi:small redox-active disulfide protein 2|uniref:Thioredoxin n=1 Tax=Methanocorpusculum parvum TaxID=2193 RepID=A0AAX0Q804_9EURY|nr:MULTISPECIES: thioredoxin family protein [Methanocorpusculum]NCB75138.1 thioredoxin family protein [Clostridia bacterium]MDD2249233.1 thioredoxin family protein [Methanocorpusculum sp.]MDD2803704.1 thioredoxin family protein [Methanocorpusculum sp.]MDD3047724.1 thioredoxin family protein [Methanocorpusculum sp.]MDD3912980.1 thioredoxin family protein [Methanocorpusculum sp.]
MTKIEVLGTGCAKCKRLFANTEQAIKELNITVDLVKIEKLDEITERGVMMTPALIIDDEIAAEGRVPDVKEIKAMLTV